MRILLIADDCNPDWPSLPIVGDKLCRAIAEQAEAVVATHVRNRENITKVGFGRATVELSTTNMLPHPSTSWPPFCAVATRLPGR